MTRDDECSVRHCEEKELIEIDIEGDLGLGNGVQVLLCNEHAVKMAAAIETFKGAIYVPMDYEKNTGLGNSGSDDD